MSEPTYLVVEHAILESNEAYRPIVLQGNTMTQTELFEWASVVFAGGTSVGSIHSAAALVAKGGWMILSRVPGVTIG